MDPADDGLSALPVDQAAVAMIDTHGADATGIVAEWIRQEDAVRVLVGEASPEQAARHYAERAEQHLALAAHADGLAVKEIHLDLSARYATLHRLAVPERVDEADRPGVG